MDFSLDSGYSGTPLVKKLGVKAQSRVLLINPPDGYTALLKSLAPGVHIEHRLSAGVDIAHVFVYEREELARHLGLLRAGLNANAAVWVSWPKKAARIATSVTEATIRELALPMGFVDIKVCAVSPVWSGLKLVVRKELR